MNHLGIAGTFRGPPRFIIRGLTSSYLEIVRMHSPKAIPWIFTSVLVAGLATLASSSGAGVKEQKKAKKIVNLATHEIIGELQAAHKYLQMANHDYQGH